MNEEKILIRKREAQITMEGAEFVRIYFHTDKLLFAICTLLPGERGPVDPGHKDADEICYVIEGKLIVYFPNKKTCYELEQGDAILVPEGEPHQPLNTSEKTAFSCWVVAPSLGRPELEEVKKG